MASVCGLSSDKIDVDQLEQIEKMNKNSHRLITLEVENVNLTNNLEILRNEVKCIQKNELGLQNVVLRLSESPSINVLYAELLDKYTETLQIYEKVKQDYEYLKETSDAYEIMTNIKLENIQKSLKESVDSEHDIKHKYEVLLEEKKKLIFDSENKLSFLQITHDANIMFNSDIQSKYEEEVKQLKVSLTKKEAIYNELRSEMLEFKRNNEREMTEFMRAKEREYGYLKQNHSKDKQALHHAEMRIKQLEEKLFKAQKENSITTPINKTIYKPLESLNLNKSYAASDDPSNIIMTSFDNLSTNNERKIGDKRTFKEPPPPASSSMNKALESEKQRQEYFELGPVQKLYKANVTKDFVHNNKAEEANEKSQSSKPTKCKKRRMFTSENEYIKD